MVPQLPDIPIIKIEDAHANKSLRSNPIRATLGEMRAGRETTGVWGAAEQLWKADSAQSPDSPSRSRIVDDQEVFRHDARSALASIRAGLWMLDKIHSTGDRARIATLIGAVDSEAERLQRLVDGDRNAVHRFDLHPVLENLAALYRARGLDTTIDSAVDAFVETSPDVLTEILSNLLDNVQTHAPGAAAHIAVDLTGDSCSLVVSDDGPGISPEIMRVATESGATTRPDGEGGVGLYAARRLAEGVGARLTIERSPSGTEVVIDLRSDSNSQVEAPA